MKNETARREIESLDYYLQNHTDDYSEESHTAMMMAIKALGQEPVLGKIRTEIEAYQSDAFYPDDVMINKKMVLEIIDRYKVVADIDHICHTCKHYLPGEYDGSCGSYICKNYSGWAEKEQE